MRQYCILMTELFPILACNDTMQGQLLLVLNSINATFRKYFSCFCKVIQARFNNTNVTIEILAGNNLSTCDPPNDQMYVDQDFLQKKLSNLSEMTSQDKYAGKAVILTDREFTAENFSKLSNGEGPSLYFVNFGETENKNALCYRQYRYVENITDIHDIGQEIENIGCHSMYFKFLNIKF